MATVLLLGWTSAGWAADADSSGTQAASYSTGQGGSRLKWLPPRPESARADASVRATQYTAPAGKPRPLRTAQNQKSVSLLSDDSGDRKNTLSPASRKSLSEDALPQVSVEPKSQGALPGLPLDEQAVAEKPSVVPERLAPLKSAKPSKNGSTPSLFDQDTAGRPGEFKETCPSPKDLKPINELTTNITPPEGALPHDCPLGNATFQPRAFAPITYTWTASSLCHKPLYFEDVQLERYGHMLGPWVQPFASGAHFFLTFPILPYKMGLEPPNECLYTLGYYRPGNCAPYLLDPIPLSVRAALFEAGAWVGGVYAIP